MAKLWLGVDPGRFEQIKRILAHMPGGAEKAVARAMNKALEAARDEAIQEILRRYTIHPNILKGTIRIIKASPQRLKATLLSRGYGVPISKFKMSHVRVPEQKGIPVALRQKVSSEIIDGVSKEWSHAFLANVQAGDKQHLGLWKRHATARTRNGRGPLLITEQFSLAVPQMISARAIITEVVNAAQERLDQTIDQEVRRLLEQ